MIEDEIKKHVNKDFLEYLETQNLVMQGIDVKEALFIKRNLA